MEKVYKVMVVTSNLVKGEKNHKAKPKYLTSVAGGVERRVEKQLESRRTNLLKAYDCGRNISISESPSCNQPTQAELKLYKRKMQLLKWKEEKDKNKKIQASKSVKPFLVGVYHAPVNFELPPIKNKNVRVTRSQTNSRSIQIKYSEELKMFNNNKKKTQTLFTFGSTKFDANINGTPKKDSKIKTKMDSKEKNIEVNDLKKVSKTNVTKKTVEVNTKTNNNIKITNQKNIKPVTERNLRSKYTKTNVVDTKTSKVNTKKSTAANTKPAPLTVKLDVKRATSIKKAESDAKKLAKAVKNMVIVNTPENKKIGRKFKDTPIVKNIRMSSTDSDSSIEFEAVKSPVPKSESLQENKLRSPKTPEEVHNYSSPKITRSRGKDEARKENVHKLKEGLLAEDMSDGQTVEQYRRQLASEISRITERCLFWDTILLETLPERIREQILAAVGLARLLMSQKLQQFGSLVERCAFPDPHSPLVTGADLTGFWDLVFIQIEDVDMKFNSLDTLRAGGWQEKVEALPVRKRTAPTKKVIRPAATSRIRDMIAAARKAQKHEVQDSKTFEGGFFNIKSPIKSPLLPSTPKNNSLLKAVVSNEAKKASANKSLLESPLFPSTPNNNISLLKTVVSSEAKRASAKKNGFAIMRASIISKNVAIEGITPLQMTPPQPFEVDLDATPARSILKTKPSVKKTNKKSLKSVLFTEDDSNQLPNPVEKENQSPKRPSLKRQNADSSFGKRTPRTTSSRRCSLEDMDANIMDSSRSKQLADTPRVLRRSTRLSSKY